MSFNRTTIPCFSNHPAPIRNRQQRWFTDHLLLLGAWAWQGFLHQGRGLVLIRATTQNAGPWSWSDEPSEHEPLYLEASAATTAINQLPDNTSRHQIQTAMRTYDPTSDAIAYVLFAEQPLVVHLKHMQIPPAQAYRLMERRCDEFDLS